MTPIYQKSIGIDSETGSEVVIKVWEFYASAKLEKITVDFDLVYLSPNGIALKTESTYYIRENLPEVLYKTGEEITPAVMHLGEVITQAVLADGTEVKYVASMKFDEYRNAAVGQMITGLIAMTIDTIQSVATATDDTRQKRYNA